MPSAKGWFQHHCNQLLVERIDPEAGRCTCFGQTHQDILSRNGSVVYNVDATQHGPWHETRDPSHPHSEYDKLIWAFPRAAGATGDPRKQIRETKVLLECFLSDSAKCMIDYRRGGQVHLVLNITQTKRNAHCNQWLTFGLDMIVRKTGWKYLASFPFLPEKFWPYQPRDVKGKTWNPGSSSWHPCYHILGLE